MSKKIIITIVCFGLLLPMFSCKKWLDLQPQDGITGAEFWKTKEQVNAAVVGIYASLLTPTVYNSNGSTASRGQSDLFFLWGELRADMIAAALSATNEEVDVINANILASNTIANWRPIYQTINYCNTVIDHAPDVLQNDPTFTQDALNKALAEAKTIRALMYFYLVRTFGDVPLKLKSSSSDQDIQQLAKSSQQDVLAQILKDLSEAEPNTVFTYGNKASDKGRITRFTVYAIQADVNLWMDKYNECIDACNKIISSQQFGLLDGTSQNIWFTTLFANGNSNEGIFELQFDKQAQNSFYNLLVARRRFLAAPRVLDEIYTVDYTDPNNYDIRGDGASVRSTDLAIWKYWGWNVSNARASDESYAHWIFYRYADIVLMKAEALNQLGSGQEALNLVYTIRKRAHALAATDKNPGITDKREIADFILDERAREFAFEGKRWFDLLRNAKRNNYERLDILLELVAKTVAPDRQQSAIAKFKDKNSHYLPIYTYELQTNKNLVQNPFYK